MCESVEVVELKCEDAVRLDVRACRGCLATEGRLHDLRETQLHHTFSELTGCTMSMFELPLLACPMCLHLLRKFRNFRARCQNAAFTLQQMYYQNPSISTASLSSIDTKHLKHNLVKTDIKILSCDSIKHKTKRNTKRKVTQKVTLNKEILPPEEVFVDVKDSPVKKQEFSDEDDYPLILSVGKPPMVTIDLPEENENAVDYTNNDDDNNDDDYKPNEAESDATDDDDDFDLNNAIKNEKSPTKTKKNNKKTNKVKVKRKIKTEESEEHTKTKKRKELKERTEDKKLIKEIGEIFKKMWRWKTEEKMDIYIMFEKIHEESVSVKNGDSGGCKCEPKHKKGMVCVKQELRILLDYVKKLSELYNVDVEFLSVEGQKREIEDRRKSVEYIEAQYKCELCCKIFNFPDTYKRHMASHDVHPGDVECEICRYRFKRHASLMSHIHTMHSKKLKCKECGFVNRTWNLAKEHYDFHQGVAPVCHLCGKNFTEKKHYAMHLRQVHRAQVATTLCLLCGDSFNGPTGLRIHMDRSHRQAAKCPSCDGWFLNSEMLDTHLSGSAGGCQPGLSACPMCGGNFSSEQLMWQHHDEQHIQEYKCEECNKTYAGLRKYKWHVENKHAKGKRGGGVAAGAGAGGKPRKRPQDYRGNKNFVCDICGKDDFPFLSSLRFHQRKHTDEKPHECNICRKSFREKLNLKVHMTIHTDERRYQCPYCPKAFRQFSHRTVHIRTHTKEKPYSCTVCEKQFSHRSVMLEHIRTVHEGQPPRRRYRHHDTHAHAH